MNLAGYAGTFNINHRMNLMNSLVRRVIPGGYDLRRADFHG